MLFCFGIADKDGKKDCHRVTEPTEIGESNRERERIKMTKTLNALRLAGKKSKRENTGKKNPHTTSACEARLAPLA